MRHQEVAVGQTEGDGKFVRLWTSGVLPPDCTWHIEAAVLGTSLSAGDDRHVSWLIDVAAMSTAGEAGIIGEPRALFCAPTHVGMAVDVGCDRKGRRVFLEVRDDGVVAMRFKALVVRLEIV